MVRPHALLLALSPDRICKLCWRLCPDRTKLELHREREHAIAPDSAGAEEGLWADCVTWPAQRAEGLREMANRADRWAPSATDDASADLYDQLPISAPPPMDVDPPPPSHRRPVLPTKPLSIAPVPYLPPREPTPPPTVRHSRSPSFSAQYRPGPPPPVDEYDPSDAARRSPSASFGPSTPPIGRSTAHEPYSPDQPAMSPQQRQGAIPGLSWA